MEDKINPRTQRAREAIMEATHRLVSKRPVAEISLTEIAEEANVSRPTIYNQFKDTPTLVAVTSEYGMHDLFRRIDEQLPQKDDEQHLRKLMRLFVKGVYEQRDFAKNAMWGPSSAEITAAVVRLLSDKMRQGFIGKSLARKASINMEDCLDAISGGAIWMLTQWLISDFKGDNSPKNMADRYTEMFLSLVR